MIKKIVSSTSKIKYKVLENESENGDSYFIVFITFIVII